MGSHLRFFGAAPGQRWLALPFLAIASLVTSACSFEATGDAHRSPDPNALGRDGRVSDFVSSAPWFDAKDQTNVHCSFPPDRAATLAGLSVVAVDRFAETGTGSSQGFIFLQDVQKDPTDYAGIAAFGSSFAPPDLRLAPGDVVDARGTIMEFSGPSSVPFGYCKTLPEFTGTLSLRFEDKPILPKPVTLDDLTLYPNARKLLGMLVRVSNVTLLTDGEEDKAGRYAAKIDSNAPGLKQSDYVQLSNELFDLKNEGPALVAGKTFKSITGVVTFFSSFKIAARSRDDFEE